MSPRVTPQPVNAGRRLRWMSSATAIDRRDPCSLDHLPEFESRARSQYRAIRRPIQHPGCAPVWITCPEGLSGLLIRLGRDNFTNSLLSPAFELHPAAYRQILRSEERGVGKECVSTCRARGC